MIEFDQLISVNFQGVVVVFGRSTSIDSRDIYFNVLGLDIERGNDDLDWTGFTKLDFTRQVRQVGMSIITLLTNQTTMVPSMEPFRVVTDQKYISVVQQSVRGTLYVNRFRLLQTKSGTNQKTTTYTLSPAWEVRYSRSHKEDVPADKSDTQAYLDPDGSPFLEPSQELSMITAVQNGGFDVILLPVSGTSHFTWQFMTLDSKSLQVSLFNIPSNDSGLFDISAKKIGSDYKILPDSTFSITKANSKDPLAIQSAPRAVVYVKHEKIVQPDGTSIGVKRASRVMIAIPVVDAGKVMTATIDSAVGNSGTIAKLEGAIAASQLVPAEFDFYFDGVSSLSLLPPGTGGNPLGITGPYSMRFMLNPGAKGDGVAVISGSASDAKTLAPFVTVVDGDKIEVGFGNGSETVRCRTLHQVLFTGSWSRIAVDYRGTGANPFTVTVNDTVVPVTACSTATGPSGSPVTRIGSATGGFIGALDTVEIVAGATSIVKLACNTVNYSVNPPTTPNDAASGVIATVSGAKLEPSSSPVNSDMSGTFYIDAMGLTYYAGLADFIQPKAAACLIEGSDALLHLYYQGADALLSVAQFSTSAARATFTVDWTTNWSLGSDRAIAAADALGDLRHMGWAVGDWAPVASRLLAAPDKSQSGFVNFVAHRVGTYMNASKITVTSSTASPLLCDVTVEAPADAGTEVWRGLPRNVNQLAQIWNGAGANNPDDQDVIDKSAPYYDYSAKEPAVIVPMRDDVNGSYFLVTSVPTLPVKLASMKVESGKSAEFVNISLEVAAPANWQSSQTLQQYWPDVPVKPRSILDVFGGKATRYAYDAVTTPGSRAYGLQLSTSRSDDQVSHVLVFVRDELKDFTLTIGDGSAQRLCTVTVCNVVLADVSRSQADFVKIINGESTTYPYPPGYRPDLTSKIFTLGNGLTADVVNRSGPVTSGGAFAYAGLLRVLYTGQNYDASAMATIATTPAAVIQGAKLRFKSREDVIQGSMLFGAIILDPPTDGGVGKLTNTSGYSGGSAPVLTPGVNGGWMPVSPKFSLGLSSGSGASYVGFNVDKSFSPSEQLAILSDLTTEAWLWQDPAKPTLLARALTYNVLGNRTNPGLPVQYMMGAKQGPGLIANTSTFISKAFNFSPPNLTVQIYIKLQSSSTPGTILSIGAVKASTEYISLALNAYGKAELKFSPTPTPKIISTAGALPKDVWVCLTATVADAGSGTVSISLAVNADVPVTATVPSTFKDMLGTLLVGSNRNQGIKASLNGVAFWQRALSPTEVQNSYNFGFADNDDLLGIRWNLAEGAGVSVMNSAATGIEYDATVINPASPSWDGKGAFTIPYAGRNDLILASNRILKGWTHVALASRQGYGLKLNGSNSGQVTDGTAFNPSSAFSIEAWIAPTVLNKKQIIVEKPGSYSLYVSTDGQVCLKVTVQQDADDPTQSPVVFTREIKATIPVGKTSYVVVNFSTGSVQNDQGTDQYAKQYYYTSSSIFLDGSSVKTDKKADYLKSVTVSNIKSSFYLGISGDNTFTFEGLVSHVRVWNRTRTAAEIAETNALRLTPVNRDGLTAGWDFDDMSGTVAKDLTGNNDLQLTSNQLWSIWQDVAQASIYVNGGHSLPRRYMPTDIGGYQDIQYTLGGALQGSSLTSPFVGKIDDIRLFSTMLTEQQVREGMNTPLTGGEDSLAAYWKIDAGSGTVLYDITGRGNNGSLMPSAAPPTWQATSAPIQNEAQYVVNALGGQADYFVAKIAGQPSVIEYAGAEKDAYGKVFSVLKRGYFYLSAAGRTDLQVGYKVGDLDTIFVGQVQSKPTIIGYIEGGPPIPSENQTLAYWSGDGGGPAKFYAAVSTVTYQESDTRTWSFTANQSSVFNGSFNIKGGFLFKGKTLTSIGLGAEAEAQVADYKVGVGAKFALSGDIGGSDSVAQSHSNTLSLSTSMTPAGLWEPANAILNPVVGRRYIQNNIGLALVKSATADLFMLALKGTQTPVGYSLVPNKTIPVDTNIIDFPINPKYVKNGTLDGKIGLMNDPDYPNANAERGSYFKPVEAYAIKRRIEKEEQQIKAYYDQFDVNKYRVISSLSGVQDKLKENTAFDFGNNRNQRSLYNNYIWTAAGGLHKEEYSVANTYSETYTGTSSLKFALGAEVKVEVASPFGGYYIESDAMLGNTWTMTATKSTATANAFRLNCIITPTDFLAAPIITQGSDGQLKFDGYQDAAAPGKVDAYRYMSFLLAPSAANFTALNGVVDQNWLQNGTTAAANAMREAMATPSEPWRVLYRSTYVSRVPAPFQPVKDDTNAPNITPPANLPSNQWLVSIIGSLLSKPNPTRLEIGAAIDTVLGVPGQGPGLLKDLIPWWSDFYTAAKVYGSVAFGELADLRIDLLGYIVSKYEAENYALS